MTGVTARATKSGVRIEVPIAIGIGTGPQFIQKETRRVFAFWAEGGLAVTRSVNMRGRWEISHCVSGYTLPGPYRTRTIAVRAAKRFLALGDWTRSRTAVRRDAALKRAARVLKDQLISEGVLW